MRDAPAASRTRMQIVAAPAIADGCRLHTATLSLVGVDGSVVELFHACRAATARDVVVRIAARHGAVIAGAACVRAGVDPQHPIVASLLGAAVARTLSVEGDLPGGALLDGGDVQIVQRRG